MLQFGLLVLFLLSGCRSGDKSVAFLKYWIIDPNPNTGTDCCSDILMLGDINKDGNMDVVIGSEKSDSAGLVWYQYPTWEKHPVASGEFTTDGQLTDIDGDGDLDIVVSTLVDGKGEIIWFENLSGTGNGEWRRHFVGNGYGHDLVVGDMNKDGKIDIVTCDKKKVVFWEQLNLDSFKEHLIIERQGEGIALTDIDRDKNIDIVYGGSWLENPGFLKKTPWKSHTITPQWSPDTRVFVADMNKDDMIDVVLSVSEGKGSLSWFESPRNPRTNPWVEHPIEKGVLDGAHSLQVADIDRDGDMDVIIAEMHTSRKRRVLVYLNEGESFIPMVLIKTGSHNMRVGDIDGDGDIDIVGKNYAGKGRVIEMWENLSSIKEKWEYISIDRKRPKSQKDKMGLLFVDADRDGLTDIVAGSILYLNPRGKLQMPWKRTELPAGIDLFFTIDVDGDQYCDLVGINGDTVQWIETNSEKLDSWKTISVAKVVKGRTQGYVKAYLSPGGKPQMVFTRGKNLYVMEIPADPEKVPWPLHLISTENEEEGLAAGDIDGDGDLDIAAVHVDGHQVVWFENPGSLAEQWKMHFVGGQIDPSQTWLDRIAIADLNNDGRLDIIATEERQDWKLTANLYWFEAPVDLRAGKWDRHIIARHRSINSMDIVDVDGDGDIDIAVAEHTDQKNEGAQDNLTVVYLNKDSGRTWIPRVVERGSHSSHLGARFVDLDDDAVFEIVSTGWNQYQYIHLWKHVPPGSGLGKGREPFLPK